MQPGAILTLRLLGGLQIATADGRDVTPPGKKLRALAICLALAPEGGWSRERLMTLLWGDRDEEQARGSLRHGLAELRRLFANGALLRADRETAAFDSALVTVDAIEFERLILAGDLARAAELYRGDLLAGVSLPDAEFMDWLLVERMRLQNRAIDVLAQLAVLQSGESAIRTAQRLLQLDPLHEAMHRRLIRLYLIAGQRSQALRQYQICSSALQSELGVKPEDETERLFMEIQAASGGLALREQPILTVGATNGPERGAMAPNAIGNAQMHNPIAGLRRPMVRVRARVTVAIVALLATAYATWFEFKPDPAASPTISMTTADNAVGAVARSESSAASSAMPLRDPSIIEGIPIIVVLPFSDLTGDGNRTELGIGIAEKFATDLSMFPDFNVVSSTSALGYIGKTVPEIKRSSGATFVVEGDYRRGSKLTLEIRLVRASTDWRVWRGEIEQEMSEPITLQLAAAERLRDTFGGLTGALREDYTEIAKSKVLGDLDGNFHGDLTEYDYYVLGHIYHLRAHLNRGDTGPNTTHARAIWERGLKQFPNSVLLIEKLAFTYDPRSAKANELINSIATLKKRNRLDEWYYHWLKAASCKAAGKSNCAITEANAAIKLAPYDPLTHAALSGVALATGEVDDAIAWATFGLTHDLDPQPWYFDNLLRAYAGTDRWDEVIALAESHIEIDQPLNRHWYRLLARAYQATSRPNEAKKASDQFLSMPDTPDE